MGLELVVGGGVGAGVLYLWGWRSLKYVRHFLNRARRAKTFEHDLRAFRAHLAVEAPYRIATTSDAALVARLADRRLYEPFVAQHFTALGDVVMLGTEGAPIGAMRALVDAERRVVAMVGVSPSSEIKHLQLVSFGDQESFATSRGARVTLAELTSIHRQTVAVEALAETMITKHRELLQAAKAPLVQISSSHDLVAQLHLMRRANKQWRDDQPPDELLDADLRLSLGKAYASTGKTWARRLRGGLPEARLRN